MILNPCEPKAHLIIGFNPDRLLNSNQDIHLSLSYIQKKLSADIPEYKVHLLPNKPDYQIQAFNAHLNFEAVSYQDQTIKYPRLEKQVLNLLDCAVNEALSNTLPPLSESDEDALTEALQFCANIDGSQSSINELNQFKTNPSQRFGLIVGEDIKITLQNFKYETLLIANWYTSVPTLKSVLRILENIHAKAFESGFLSVSDSEVFSPNAFGSINIPDYLDDVFYGNEAIQKFINAHLNHLEQIDPERNIQEHQETLWINFITSYKSGALEKIRKLTYPEGL